MNSNTRILIVGGGIGGFTAALALLRKGFAVHLMERAPQLGEVGAGLQNSPNAVRVLHALGLREAYESACYIPKERELRMWDSGVGPKRPMANSEVVAKYGFPHINMHRADLHQALVDACKREPRCTIQLNAECVDVAQDENSVSVRLKSGEVVTGDALIGADGIRSKIREKLFGYDEPKFTKCVVWRATVPVDRLPESMWQRKGETWIGRDAHISLYPIRRGELINFVGHLDRDEWTESSWVVPGSREELAKDFAGWHEEIQTVIANAENPTKWGLFTRETLQRWSVGRITLLGDACHSMLPYHGQGANMAIEDGYVLGRCLEAYAHDIPAALRSYEAARVERATRVVQLSNDNVKYFRVSSFNSDEEAKEFLSNAWDAQVRLRDWIFSYDATSVPIDDPEAVEA
ncbi:FAD-dependent monooxygenase [uncultured Pigmentiphaga sp.]|jgi:2-polyprenyl-6-methoxyphenol hydroxylase and related FAD-dependent oxidoreductases|uniref:FAD-dependent monooxygenase n=1 Tax=uncultured Pigmentiphaga sp. TaxID=340361 RepID=UPI00262797E6|nr:FAD-dependent monooxygenase [uncultured Pigmentiphaga sp.]